MARTRFLLLVALAVAALAGWGCDGGGIYENVLSETLWDFYGYGEVKTGLVTPAMKEDCGGCHILMFDKDGTFTITLVEQKIQGSYRVLKAIPDKQYDFVVTDLRQTKGRAINITTQREWGTLLRSSVKKFVLHENELKLYYNDNKNFLRYVNYYCE
jgi:hypothetical protein